MRSKESTGSETLYGGPDTCTRRLVWPLRRKPQGARRHIHVTRSRVRSRDPNLRGESGHSTGSTCFDFARASQS